MSARLPQQPLQPARGQRLWVSSSTHIKSVPRPMGPAEGGPAMLDNQRRTTDRIHMTVRTKVTEVWQARIGNELATQLRADSEVLGLHGRTDIVKAGLEMLHRRAAAQRMANSVDDFYRGSTPDLPIGVQAADDEAAELPSADRVAERPDGAA